MPLNPSPTIDANLALVTVPISRSDMSREALLTFSCDTIGTPGATLAQNTADTFFSHFTGVWASIFDSEVTIHPVSVKLGDGSTTPFEAISAAAPVPGTNSGTFVPPNVALLVKKRTALGGKKNRGRTYYPFVLATADVLENGNIDPTLLSPFATATTGFLNGLSTADIPMVISHKVFNVPLPPHYVTAIHGGALVTSYLPEPMVATQRRRLGR